MRYLDGGVRGQRQMCIRDSARLQVRGGARLEARALARRGPTGWRPVALALRPARLGTEGGQCRPANT